MIDFRYHIVSIFAIFLALGLGVLVGTTVLDRVTVEALEGRVDDLRDRLNDHREEIRNLRADRDRATDLVNLLAPEVTEGVLAGVRVLFVTGEEEADWHGRVREGIEGAGGQDAGTISLTSRWLLDEAEDRDELVRAFGEIELSERDPATDAAVQLGELLITGDTEGVVSQLADAGFVRTAPTDQDGVFPPSNVQVVVLASDGEEPLAAVARGTVAVTATLGVAPSVEDLGAVAILRRTEDAPASLATFDSAADDPAAVGTVLALRAAVDGAGGHFGRASGLRYIPAPP